MSDTTEAPNFDKQKKEAIELRRSMVWDCEIAPFSKQSPIAIIIVTGTFGNGLKCKKEFLVTYPRDGEIPDPVYNAEWIS